MSWIYIIGITRNPVKIGMATNLKKRLCQLQIGCPDELIVHHTLRTATRNLKIAEGLIHNKLADHHRRGEWFNVDADAAFEEAQKIVEFVDKQDRREGSRGWDPLDRLVLHYEIDPGARVALRRYRDEKAVSRGVPLESELYIQRSFSIEAFLGLKHLANQMDFGACATLRIPGTAERAARAMAAGVNALADFYAFEAEQKLLDEIQSLVA